MSRNYEAHNSASLVAVDLDDVNGGIAHVVVDVESKLNPSVTEVGIGRISLLKFVAFSER